jgi:hypothetical protein
MLARLRKLIHEADPEIVEEWKWMGTPIFSHAGIVTTGKLATNGASKQPAPSKSKTPAASKPKAKRATSKRAG